MGMHDVGIVFTLSDRINWQAAIHGARFTRPVGYDDPRLFRKSGRVRYSNSARTYRESWLYNSVTYCSTWDSNFAAAAGLLAL